MSTRLEDEVREALWAGTESLSTPPDAYDRVMATVALRRRRRTTVITGAAATLALAGVIGLAARTADDGSRMTTPATRISAPRTDRPSEARRFRGPASQWPARGSLGTDPTFSGDFATAVGAEHHLVFAEDGVAGRMAVAVSADGETVVFHGRAGEPVAELERFAGLPASGRDLVVAVPVGAATSPAAEHLVVTLTAPHLDDAQISLPSVARDGSVYREWRKVPVADGVGRIVTADPVGAVRVRTGSGDGAVQVVAGPVEPPGALECGRCDETWLATEGLEQFRHEAAATVGAATEQVSARMLFEATSPAAGGRVVGYLASLPTGGLLRAMYVATDRTDGPRLSMIEPLRPLPADDPLRPVLISVQPSGDLVVVAPGLTRIGFSPTGAAPPLSDVALSDGIGVLIDPPSDPAAYRIVSYDVGGGVLRSWHGSMLTVRNPLQVDTSLTTRGTD